MLHMIRKSHISHAVCLYREEFTGSLSLIPSALVSASSSSPSSCALASPSSMVSHLTALIFTINSFNHVTPFLIISVTDLLYGKFVCFPAFYFLNRTLIIFFYILFSWLNDEYFFLMIFLVFECLFVFSNLFFIRRQPVLSRHFGYDSPLPSLVWQSADLLQSMLGFLHSVSSTGEFTLELISILVVSR